MDEVVELVRERSRDLPRGEWIVGRGWDQELWPDRSMPWHQLLTSAVPDHPAWLVRVDAHAGLANAAAMRAAGVDAAAASPEGGLAVKEEGRLTGLFVDDAMQLIESRMPSPDTDKVIEWYLKAQEICLSVGLTEVHEAGLSQKQVIDGGNESLDTTWLQTSSRSWYSPLSNPARGESRGVDPL